MQTPKLENIKCLSTGWENHYVLTYRLEDGTQIEYEAASRRKPKDFEEALRRRGAGETPSPDAVCIVPLIDWRTGEGASPAVLLIREFRYPVNGWCIAFPAGLLEKGETIEQCVSRELSEETGYAVVAGTSPRPLPQSGYSSTGMTDENVQVVFAYVEKVGEAHPESNELIEPFVLKQAEIRDFLDTNTDFIGTRAQLILELLANAHLI